VVGELRAGERSGQPSDGEGHRCVGASHIVVVVVSDHHRDFVGIAAREHTDIGRAPHTVRRD
jgi:hypothetical protein